MDTLMRCRNCDEILSNLVLDLGFSPPSNSFLSDDDLQKPEVYFPLQIYICSNCWLLQTADYVDENLMFPSTYVYLSSTSQSWLNHARQYVNMIVDKLKLDVQSQVVEIASNDGYLLKNFNELGIPNLGIEPTSRTADVAEAQGVNTIREFFSHELATKLVSQEILADLIIGNNVYAHVPDINDFTRGIAQLLNADGVVTLEFPHAVHLITENQFDTIYHEHFSYLTLGVVQSIFEKHGLRIFDVDQLVTHGGSLRVYGCHKKSIWKSTEKISLILQHEDAIGMRSLDAYAHMQSNAVDIKNNLLRFLIGQKELGHRVIGYGAAAKGNTLLNFAGIRSDLVQYVVDGAVSKQGKFLPGSHISVKSPSELDIQKNDNLLILPWNISEEVKSLVTEKYGNSVKIWTAIPSITQIN